MDEVVELKARLGKEYQENARLRTQLAKQDEQLKVMAVASYDRNWPEAQLNLKLTIATKALVRVCHTTESDEVLVIAERALAKMKVSDKQVTDTDALAALRALVVEQAEDEGLWAVHLLGTQPITEAYLQQELRKLHDAVEKAVPARSEKDSKV